MSLRVGTRSSRLAMAQAHEVAESLEDSGASVELETVQTHGDRSRSLPLERIGVAGAFTAALEEALLAEEVDLAVHSLKDLPVQPAEGLAVAAILPRGRAQDAILVRPDAFQADRDPPVREGARVATSGPRRRSQLMAADDSIVPVDVRGNVDTRIGKLADGRFDALVTARVALDRADFDTDDLVVRDLDLDGYPCAPGQAAIAVQAREDSPAAKHAASLDHEETRSAVEAERRVLDRLGGGCGLALGAHAHRRDQAWRLEATFAGRTWTPAHAAQIERVSFEGADPSELADRAAGQLDPIEAGERTRPIDETPRPEGPSIVVVASKPTADRYAAHLREAGYDALPTPTRTFEPVDAPTGDERDRLVDVDWIAVTSRQAVDPLARLVDGDLPDVYVGAVGPSTARALQRAELAAHVVPHETTARGLAEKITEIAEPGRVLLPRGDRARDESLEVLEAAGFEPVAWTAYRTVEHQPAWRELDVSLPADAAVVMSPRNAKTLPEDAGALAKRFVAIGPTTAKALEDRGIDPIVAPAPRPSAIAEVLP